jgi:hypothetical protein
MGLVVNLNQKTFKNNVMEHNISDIKVWIERVIDSCNNSFHFEVAQTMIYKFNGLCKYESQRVELQDYFNIKFNAVHGILTSFDNYTYVTLGDGTVVSTSMVSDSRLKSSPRLNKFNFLPSTKMSLLKSILHH